MQTELLKQLEINNNFIKSFLSCLDESTQNTAREIIINNTTILLNSVEPGTEAPKQNNFISDETLTDMLLNRGLPNTKPLKTLCNKAIENRGVEAFKLFIDEVSDYLSKYKANNINSFFNKCLCNFIKTGRTPYSQR